MGIIAIDPGKDYFGWAEYDTSEDVLIQAGVWRKCDNAGLIEWTCRFCTPIYRVIIERMVQRGVDSRVKMSDLIAVTETGNLAAGYARADLTRLTPREWKGTLPPLQEQARSFSALTPAERTCVTPLSKDDWSHAMSAVGIGLSYLRRFDVAITPEAFAYVQARTETKRRRVRRGPLQRGPARRRKPGQP